MKNSFKNFFNVFLRTNKNLLLLSTVGILCIVAKFFIKKFKREVTYAVESSQCSNILVLFPLSSLLYILCSPFLELAKNCFSVSLFNISFAHFYSIFLSYPLCNWEGIIQGDLYSSLHRRSKGVSSFFKTLIFDMTDSFLYITLNTIDLLFHRKYQKYFSIAIVTIFTVPLFLNLFTILRTRILSLSNDAYDKGEIVLKDIFVNYDIITAYKMLDSQIARYNQAFSEFRFLFMCYWMVNSCIEFLQNIIKLMFPVFIFSYLDPSIPVLEKDLFSQKQQFESMAKRVYSFTNQTKFSFESRENALNSNLEKLVAKGKDRDLTIQNLYKELTVKNLSMSYQSNVVFSNINFNIPAGNRIAITGPNGTGKTSFLKSLLSLEEYTGEILIDGIDTSHIKKEGLAKIFSYVPQESGIFEGSLLENITLFDKNVSRKQVEALARSYGLEKSFSEVGYDTPLLDRCGNLSMAIRHKISFMRAALKDTPVIIFDETLADLDKESEEQLLYSILALMKNKTIIMIIHNLKYLPLFDQVIFFNKKSAIGPMPYNQLISDSNEFKEYVNANLHTL